MQTYLRELLFGAAEWVIFCCMVCGEKPALLTAKRVVSMLIVGILVVFDIYYFNAVGCYQLGMLFVIYFVFQFSFWEGVRVWIVVYSVLGICHQCLQFVLRNFLWRSQWKWTATISKIIVSVLCLLLYKLIPGHKRIRIGQMPFRFWSIVAGALFALHAMMVYLGITSFYIRGRRGSVVWAAVIIFGVIGIFLILVLCIYYYRMYGVLQLQNEYAEKFNAQQKEYFDRLIEKEQDTRNFRHEISNHLVSISGMANRHEYEALNLYVKELLGELHDIGIRQYDLGNHMMNTIVNYYFLPIRDTCELTVSGYVDEIDAISGPDLCVLVSNLVKNAVEAVEQIIIQEKKIRFEVDCGKQYFHICVQNTMLQEKKEESGFLTVTSKQDKKNHGIGLYNVRKIVEKYDGKLEYGQREGVFIAEAYLKLNSK